MLPAAVRSTLLDNRELIAATLMLPVPGAPCVAVSAIEPTVLVARGAFATMFPAAFSAIDRAVMGALTRMLLASTEYPPSPAVKAPVDAKSPPAEKVTMPFPALV